MSNRIRGAWWKPVLLGGALWSVALVVARPALADTDFQVKKMTRSDVPLGKGQCDIRLRIDGEAEVSVRGDRVHLRTISGSDGRNDGSECNEPMPARPLTGFSFEVLDQRGEIRLLSEPDRLTSFSAVVRIRDSEGGEGRYHFRLSWQLDGGGPGRAPGGGFDPGDRGRGPDDRGPGDRGPGARFPVARALDVCRDAVRDRITRDYRYNDVDVLNVRADDRPGRNDWIIGDATGRSGRNIELFIFSCQVDFGSGRVRSVDVRIR